MEAGQVTEYEGLTYATIKVRLCMWKDVPSPRHASIQFHDFESSWLLHSGCTPLYRDMSCLSAGCMSLGPASMPCCITVAAHVQGVCPWFCSCVAVLYRT